MVHHHIEVQVILEMTKLEMGMLVEEPYVIRLDNLGFQHPLISV